MTPPLEREALMPRIDGITKNIARLRQLGMLPQDQFAIGDNFDILYSNLHFALEGVFHIGAHLLSRMPGARATEYREIAERLGEVGIVDLDFAKKKLVPMAKLRNLLVHKYASLDLDRLYVVVTTHLVDIEEFLRCVKKVIDDPAAFGLTLV